MESVLMAPTGGLCYELILTAGRRCQTKQGPVIDGFASSSGKNILRPVVWRMVVVLLGPTDMESSLEVQMDEVMERGGVVGVIAADPRGLCVAARGEIEPSQSGYVAELCQKSSKLAKDPEMPPTIVLETGGGKPYSLMIKPMRNVCSGVLLKRKVVP